jgi:Family of unknown function (DUF5761)
MQNDDGNRIPAYSGRIDLSGSVAKDYRTDFRDEWNGLQMCTDKDIGNLEKTPVSELFFSDINVQAVQQGIKNMVYKTSNGKYNLDDQDQKSLFVVMNATYLTYARHIDTDVLEQVRTLNRKCIEECVKIINNELSAYDHYIKDISSHMNPMPHFMDTSSKGTKTVNDPSRLFL